MKTFRRQQKTSEERKMNYNEEIGQKFETS